MRLGKSRDNYPIDICLGGDLPSLWIDFVSPFGVSLGQEVKGNLLKGTLTGKNPTPTKTTKLWL